MSPDGGVSGLLMIGFSIHEDFMFIISWQQVCITLMIYKTWIRNFRLPETPWRRRQRRWWRRRRRRVTTPRRSLPPSPSTLEWSPTWRRFVTFSTVEDLRDDSLVLAENLKNVDLDFILKVTRHPVYLGLHIWDQLLKDIQWNWDVSKAVVHLDSFQTNLFSTKGFFVKLCHRNEWNHFNYLTIEMAMYSYITLLISKITFFILPAEFQFLIL